MDSVGRALVTTLPGSLEDAFTHYDARGRVDTLRVGGRRWEYHYEDPRGRLTRFLDPLDRETRLTYDEADRLVNIVLPGGADTTYFEYDANGNTTGFKPPGRPFHQFGLTPGNLTRVYDPPNVAGLVLDSTHYEYNADHELTRIDRPDGQSVSLGYDAAGRVTGITQPRGSSILTYISSGNGAGQVSTMDSPDGVELTFAYDGDLPTNEVWTFGGGVSGSVGYAYDPNVWTTHQLVSGTTGTVSDVTYAFDSDGLVEGVGLPGGPVLRVSPDPTTGLIDSVRISGLAVRYGYNGYAELTSGAAWYGSDTLYSARYEHDLLGRITRIVETVSGSTTDRAIDYDVRGRLRIVRDSLTHAILGSYAYDSNGNRTSVVDGNGSRSGTFDDQDRLLALGGTSYAYTAIGERKARIDGAGALRMTYDLLGSLLKVNLVNGDSVEYLVDGRNRRVGRKLNGVLTARWIYGDGRTLVGELDASGALAKRFVYSGTSHVPEIMVLRSGPGTETVYRLVVDHLGSVRLVVNANTGQIVQRLSYDAWGIVTEDTQPGFQPFGYAGGLYDPATGLLHFGARDYDPEAGVWTTKDPIDFAGGEANLSGYAGGDPINRVDPAGLDVTIYQYPGAGGAGHAAVGVGNSPSVGWYPARIEPQNWAPGTPGYLVYDRMFHKTVERQVTIKTTPGQDEMVRRMIRERARMRGMFRRGRMCTNFADDVVQALGIELEEGRKITPKAYIGALDKYLDEHPDRRGRPPGGARGR